MSGNTGRLAGQVALITGGTSGIGKVTALLFGREGATVIITELRQVLGQAVAADIEAGGGQAYFVPADHTRVEDCRRVVELAQTYCGRLDILFNNAGIVIQGSAEETSETDWAETLALNVTAVWRMSRLVLPLMRAQGSGVIINNASDWGLVGAPRAVAYCTSKGAVIQMTRAMALDHAAEHIRINAVCPGDTYVERWLENGYFKDSVPVSSNQIETEVAQSLPLGRVATADEIARAVLFLASDDSSYMTGATLVVDGGNTAGGVS